MLLCVEQQLVMKKFPAPLAALLFFQGSAGDPIAGPYIVNVEQVSSCPEELVEPFLPINFRLLRDRHNPHNLFVSANFTTKYRLSEETDVSARLSSTAQPHLKSNKKH
ncbi:Meiotically up-regulated gene 135 protein [Frankliniella fusca]|uniref:Meiotically up-regulated gene 135 protein n=1 Tax=Frankliniella fusca TaxID=407009 RepID=A0AAE1LTI3_9NEOP|nr:Meiotically up-regulated gene 135 protein [Frankliniella fusca]